MSVGDDTKHPEGSTHLNSHANMVVVGKICLIISYSDHSAVVSGFTHEIGTVQVPIHLKLEGIFSYFDSRAPWDADGDRGDIEYIFITPVHWDPHSTHYEEEEQRLITVEGEVVTHSGQGIKLVNTFLVEDEGNF